MKEKKILPHRETLLPSIRNDARDFPSVDESFDDRLEELYSVLRLEPLPYSRLLDDADEDEPFDAGSMLSLIFFFPVASPSPPTASLIWFMSWASTASITCFPWLWIWLLLLDDTVDDGDDVWPICRSGRLLLACSLIIFCVSSLSFTSMFFARSQSVLVDDDTTLPVFSSMSTWELTFFTTQMLELQHGASSSKGEKLDSFEKGFVALPIASWWFLRP